MLNDIEEVYRAVLLLGKITRVYIRKIMNKRISIVSSAYFPTTPQEFRLALSVKDENWDVDVICLKQRDDQKNEVVYGINVYRLPISRKRGGAIKYIYRYALLTIAVFLKLTVLYFAKQYSIIEVHSMPDFLVFTSIIPKLLGIHVILFMTDLMPEVYATKKHCSSEGFMLKLLKLLERMSTNFADAIITVNNNYAQLLGKRGTEISKITVLHNAPRESVFGKLRTPKMDYNKEKFVLLFHGTITERHGLETAIQSVPYLKDKIPNVQLQIVGGGEYFGGEYFGKITELVNELNIEKYVWYRGCFRVEEIPFIIEQADVGVVPHRKTVFAETNVPNRVFEYLWMGKPVVMSRTQGVLNYFDDSSIMYFEPENPEDMARAILNIYNNPEKARQLVINGQKICQKYQWETEKKKYIRLIERLS